MVKSNGNNVPRWGVQVQNLKKLGEEWTVIQIVDKMAPADSGKYIIKTWSGPAKPMRQILTGVRAVNKEANRFRNIADPWPGYVPGPEVAAQVKER